MGKGFLKAKRELRQMGKSADKGTGGAEKGPCFKQGCQLNGCTIFHCVACEKLHGVGSPNVHRVQTCLPHTPEALKRIKRHALVKHPSNLLGVVAAGLKGEEI